MKIRAKMVCEEKDPRLDGHGGKLLDVRFAAVEGGDGNVSWSSRQLPSGSVVLSFDDEAAAAAFEIGKVYWIDFTVAEG